jgi:hypothetical protein
MRLADLPKPGSAKCEVKVPPAHYNALIAYLHAKGWKWCDGVEAIMFRPTASINGEIVYIHMDKSGLTWSGFGEASELEDLDLVEVKLATKSNGVYCSCSSPQVERRFAGTEWYNYCLTCRKERL